MKRTDSIGVVAGWILMVATAISSGQDGAPTPPIPTPDQSLAPGDSPTAAAEERAAKAKAKAQEAKAKAVESARLRGDLDSAVRQLTAEAKELDQLEDPKSTPVFTRPHPSLAGLGGDYADEILSRMSKPFTGNDYRDSYIRWHLVEVVKQAPEGELKKSGAKIIALVNQMPEALEVELRDEWRAEPEDIWRQYNELWRQTRTEVGYPPFERVYWGRDALKHMAPARAKEMEPVVKQMEALRAKFKVIRDEQAIKFNDRVRQVNWIVRQYRGELIYTLLLTGDSSMLERVVSEVARRVKALDRAAIDITSFIYLAAFDGVLARYSPQDLQRVGKGMETVARGAETYEKYTNGQFDPPPWAPRSVYRFSDYVFHLVKMLEDGPQLYLGSPGEWQAARSKP
jgi:hypothetical protein